MEKLRHLYEDTRMTLKAVALKMWSKFIWRRILSSGSLYWSRENFHVPQKARNLLISWVSCYFLKKDLFMLNNPNLTRLRPWMKFAIALAAIGTHLL